MNDTTHFYLDGSPKEVHGFMSREKPEPINWDMFVEEMNSTAHIEDSVEVVILRAVLFFHSEQKITIGKLREFFTEKAITLFKKDGYIEIITDAKK
jgi:hypothetical protein